jgi:hypothetical protein
MTTAAYAQVSVGGGLVFPAPTANPVPPVFFPISNSVADHEGNVLILETSFGLLTPLPLSATVLSGLAGKTHIAVLSSDGKTKNGYDFDGLFQVVGVGLNAVYAIQTSVPASSNTAARHLVALQVIAGTLPATLPSVTASPDVKLTPGTGSGDPDRLALIDSVFVPAPAAGGSTGTSPIFSFGHSIRLFTSDGTSFTANPNNPISTQ